LNWKDYQEEVAEFFRSLGLEAETDITIQGVRTKHDIDVLVKSHHAGFDITWLVECKHWKSKVSKLHVLGLREIVNDTGADRGILLAENGFQSGAIEAAALTNVHVLSLVEAKNTARNEIHSMRLRELYDRLLWCKEEYWEIPKSKRIECGLRPDAGGGIGYSGDWAVKAGEDLITKGLRGNYPIITDEYYLMISESIIEQKLPHTIENIQVLLASVEPLVQNLEDKINACKAKA
jgi:restriction system protein